MSKGISHLYLARLPIYIIVFGITLIYLVLPLRRTQPDGGDKHGDVHCKQFGWSHPDPTLQATVLVLHSVHLQTLPHTSQVGHSWDSNPGLKAKPLASHPGNAQVSGPS